MDYNINLGMYNNIFAVPNQIADEHIKLASGDNLKVLLYCLRHSGTALSEGEISRATGVAAENVNASFEFWKQRGLFDNAEITKIESLADKAVKKVNLERDPQFSPAEISDTVKNSKDVEYLFKRAEELYGRPLKNHEQQSLAVIIEDAGMKPAIALMLMEYCFSIGKSTPAFIRKMAKDWVEREINSLETAEVEITASREYYSEEGEIKRLLKVKDISDKDKQIIKKWLNQYSFDSEIIYQAYQITLEKIKKLEYTYMDTILTGWHKNGVKAVSDIDTVNKKHKDSQEAAMKPSFDLDEYDKLIMEKYK